MSIESLPTDRQNHFNLLRMIAASAVIVSHSFPLSEGEGTVEPLQRMLGFTLGAAAVKLFFAISGYFILMSFARRRSNFDFIAARVLRIFPGLAVMAILLTFAMGPAFTTEPLPDYIRAAWPYVPRTISLAFIRINLPGVFEGNPFPIAVNGSLWTLTVEVLAYAGLFALGVSGLLKRAFFPFVIAAYAVAYATVWYRGMTPIASLSLPFMVGMTCYLYRQQHKLDGRLTAALVCVATIPTLLGHPIDELWSIALAYAGLWLGFLHAPTLNRYNRLGDYSYGTYIYAWPIQQMLAASLPGIAPLQMMPIALLAAFACGALSWHLVEKPALQLRRRSTRPAPNFVEIRAPLPPQANRDVINGS